MIKAGDYVRVVGEGKTDGWVSSMDNYVGEIWQVDCIEGENIVIDGFLFREDEVFKIEDGEATKESLLKILGRIANGFDKFAGSLEAGSDSDFWDAYAEMKDYISNNF